jgi:hypothetical protein
MTFLAHLHHLLFPEKEKKQEIKGKKTRHDSEGRNQNQIQRVAIGG